MPHTNQLIEEWNKTEFSKAIKDVDLRIDKFRNKPNGYHRSSDLIAEWWLNALSQTEQECDKKWRGDRNELLQALGYMWNQYCGKDGHQFMSAGEEAEVVLRKYNLLVTDQVGRGECDYDKLDNLDDLLNNK